MDRQPNSLLGRPSSRCNAESDRRKFLVISRLLPTRRRVGMKKLLGSVDRCREETVLLSTREDRLGRIENLKIRVGKSTSSRRAAWKKRDHYHDSRSEKTVRVGSKKVSMMDCILSIGRIVSACRTANRTDDSPMQGRGGSKKLFFRIGRPMTRGDNGRCILSMEVSLLSSSEVVVGRASSRWKSASSRSERVVGRASSRWKE